MKLLRIIIPATLLLSLNTLGQTPITVDTQSTTKHGPEIGSLLIIGGGALDADLWEKFISLAGGKDRAEIVVISAAVGDSAAFYTRTVDRLKSQFGVKKVTLLHTKSLNEANSEKFIAPLKKATGVFFDGGRQWRIADSYLNTATHQAFIDVLKRGGVIAGTSAGASIQGSFLWRGDTKGPHILVGDHTQGLGFLKNSAIDQHLLKRNRMFDLVDFIKQSPKLIGIGIDESTAVLVQRDTLEVLGRSFAAIYDYNTIVASEEGVVGNSSRAIHSSSPFLFLAKGEKYDLNKRAVITAKRRTDIAASTDEEN